MYGPPHDDPAHGILEVGELTQRIKGLLEQEVGWVRVRGELSNVRVYSSGHLYFTLKDPRAQISGVMWASRLRRLPFRPREGMAVVVSGPVSVYPPRGQYQLMAESLEEEGSGALKAAFERLKARLAAEGLFDPATKRPIPEWPRRIALVTSADGAALRDLVRVIHDRAPWTELVLCPSLVQGSTAAPALVAALRLANEHSGADLVIMGRGGGSLEDLWAFNDEALARAIRASQLPVVSAVGHETDWTIADLVADLRVATPSHAGMLVPDGADLRRRLVGWQDRLHQAARGRLRDLRLQLMNLTRQLEQQDPRARLALSLQRVADLRRRLGSAVREGLRARRAVLDNATSRLEALDPLAVLGRGYALVTLEPTGDIVRSATGLAPDDRLRIRLAEGEIGARVTETGPREAD